MATTTEMRLKSADAIDHYRFDYKGLHRYLITLSAYKSKKVFTEKEIVLCVLNALRESCWKHHFDVYAYCFLPDRLVMIARGKAEYSDMKGFLATFRSLSSVALEQRLGHALWKRKYTERVLRKKEDNRSIAAGIFQLPVKAGMISSAAEYQFQGSFVLNSDKLTELSPGDQTQNRQ